MLSRRRRADTCLCRRQQHPQSQPIAILNSPPPHGLPSISPLHHACASTTMKRFKKALHRIQAKASAKRERLRGKSAAKRELNKVTTSEVQASEVLYESAQTENAGLEVPGPADSAIPSEPDQVVDLVPTSKVSYM